VLSSQSFECEVAGRTLSIQTGKLAGQAHGAVTVQYGDTVVLATCCVNNEPREGVDFLPLTIEYEERLYAAGKIPGGFIRREGRPTQEATLASRLTDRPIRPLLPKAWRREIQIIITILSVDQENPPDVMATIGSSAALSISQVPFDGPVSAVHIGYINDELVLNPTMPQLEESQLDMVVSSTRDSIAMVEAGASEVSEDIIIKAIEFGHEANQAIIAIQDQLREAVGKPKEEAPVHEVPDEIKSAIVPIIGSKLEQGLYTSVKAEREEALSAIKKEIIEKLGEQFPEDELLYALDKEIRNTIRTNVVENGRRLSGRGLEEIRPLSCEVGLLPRTHGSGLFTRGETQVMTITTLGSLKKEQQLDGLGIEDSKRFLHHYNFTPYSTGEARRVGSPGRREIGHGALAERALIPVIPKDSDFPYTIRLVSEVLSSSGSTSMASVCASSLSLMDAGIPVRKTVAGIAMGLITGDDGKYAVLTDIEGIEDNYGDMDFKVAGTTDGITALQMDTKLKGVSREILAKGLRQAKDARLFIINTMHQTIDSSRSEISRYAPRMYKMTVDPEKIGIVIGPGGKTIRAIIEETNTTIDIENDGTVIIGSTDAEAAEKAEAIIEGLTKDVEIGSIYTGKVTRLLAFGAFVEILPGKEGMVHISELADYHVNTIENEVNVGDEITVKVIKNDEGKIGLSRKALYEKAAQTSSGGTRDSSRGGPPSGRRGDFRPPRRPQTDRPKRF